MTSCRELSLFHAAVRLKMLYNFRLYGIEFVLVWWVINWISSEGQDYWLDIGKNMPRKLFQLVSSIILDFHAKMVTAYLRRRLYHRPWSRKVALVVRSWFRRGHNFGSQDNEIPKYSKISVTPLQLYNYLTFNLNDLRFFLRSKPDVFAQSSH